MKGSARKNIMELDAHAIGTRPCRPLTNLLTDAGGQRTRFVHLYRMQMTTKLSLGFWNWSLGIGASLELGHWILEIPSCPSHVFPPFPTYSHLFFPPSECIRQNHAVSGLVR